MRSGPGAWCAARPSPQICYFFARWTIAFVLTWLNPFFAFYAILGYFTADRLLPRPLVKAGLFATAVVMAGSNIGGMSNLRSWAAWAVFAAVLGAHIGLTAVFSRFAEKEQEQADAQAATIAELERTNAALQQALDENAALHAQLLVQARKQASPTSDAGFAAEIHDTIAQGLTGIIAQLQVVANAPDLPTARTHLDRASALARHSLGEARRSVQNLAPVALEHDGLPQALKKTVAEWAERTGVRAEFTTTGTAEHLHEEVSATLLRIAQEALSNASRHAQGRPPRRHPLLHGRRGRPRRTGRRPRLRPPDAPLPQRPRRLRPRRYARPRRTHRGLTDGGVRTRARYGGVGSRTVGAP